MKSLFGFVITVFILGQVVSGNVSLDRIAIWVSQMTVRVLSPVNQPTPPKAEPEA
jgi:hypothetical protein